MFRFKRDWIVRATYQDWDGVLKIAEVVTLKATKRQAIDKMYDALCWDKDGLQIGFRSVEIDSVKKI